MRRPRNLVLAGLLLAVIGATAAAVVLIDPVSRFATAEADTCKVSGRPVGGGTVTGDARVPCGDPVTLTATAHEGFCFDYWPGDEPSVGCPQTSTKVVLSERGSVVWFAIFKLAPEFYLELSAPRICDVEQGRRWSGVTIIVDGEGNRVEIEDPAEWIDPGEVRVRWTITGGTAPYTITIDGERRDGDGDYTGASGTARVSCALEKADPSYWKFSSVQRYARTYTTEPTVDSGYKLITAQVTDANGLTAEAAIEVYAVLNSVSEDDTLKAGHTYRIRGFLVTIPEGLDFEFAGVAHSECEGVGQGLNRCTDSALLVARHNGYVGTIWIGLDDGTEVGQRDIWREGAGAVSGTQGPRSQDADPSHNLDAAFDELAAGLGKLPPPPSLEVD